MYLMKISTKKTCALQTGNEYTAPARLVAVWLLYSVHRDQQWKDGLSIYVDDQYRHPSDNKHCIHHNPGKLHSANLDQFLYQDGIYCKSSQMQVQLDYADDKGPSLMNAQPASRYHTDNDFLDKDSEMPVWYQKIHFRESHLYLSYQQAHR